MGNCVNCLESYKLRLMLAQSLCGGSLYTDDGEIQDNSYMPYIDYKRDSADEIRAKLMQRELNREKERKQ